MAGRIGPEYQRLMGEIRAKITSGEYPVGGPIPSTKELAQLTGMSIPVVRRAVAQLETDGILEGHPGKAVYVRASPEAVADEQQSVKMLSEQVSELRREIGDQIERFGEERSGDLSRGLTELRESVGRVEANLISLYQMTGHAYPQGGSNDTRKPATRRRQPKQ